MAEEANNNAVETNNAGEQNTQPAQTTETKPVEGAEASNQQPNQETKPAEEHKEPELTIESYGNLGLTATEDVEIDEQLMKDFKQIALENGIKPEVANKIAKVQFDSMQRIADTAKGVHKKWEEENQKTYGDNLKNVQTNVGRVLTEFDKEGKFKELLTLVGAVDAPATLAFLKAIGDKVLEKASVNPNTNAAPTQEKELADYYNN